jgi:hypothetical protein
VRRSLLILAGVLLAVRAATAQETSPSADLLARAGTALNGLRFAEADSVARMVLALGEHVPPEQQRNALEIIAAAFYPDPAGGGKQEPDSALVYLRQIVRLQPDSGLKKDFTWPGLDSLMGVARRTTFSPTLNTEGVYTLVGEHGEGRLAVHATRPAIFSLALVAPAGGVVETDSAGPATQATLHLWSFGGGKPVLSDGRYRLALTAKDAATGDTVTRFFDAQVTASPLDLVAVPAALDSSRLKPERVPPARWRGIVGALLGGGATIAASRLLRTSATLKAGYAPDGRAYVAAGGVALGALIGGLLDRGHVLPANAAANAQLRAAFAAQVRSDQEENARRTEAYKATITVTGAAP